VLLSDTGGRPWPSLFAGVPFWESHLNTKSAEIKGALIAKKLFICSKSYKNSQKIKGKPSDNELWIQK
jgi:hypothetical protein